MEDKNIASLPTMEFFNIEPIDGLNSRCTIKVCAVGEKANYNGTVISKEVGLKLAQSLPGAPIVGHFINGDFGGHDRTYSWENGELVVTDLSQPYGFVNPDSTFWFQKFDAEEEPNLYLCCEGTLWTEQYEAAKVAASGKAQSMELNADTLAGYGSEYGFIITDATIKALCILGADVEPCFKQASVAAYTKVQTDHATIGLGHDLRWALERLLTDKGLMAGHETGGLYEDEIGKFIILQRIDDQLYFRIRFSFSPNGAIELSSDFENVRMIWQTVTQAETVADSQDIEPILPTIVDTTASPESEDMILQAQIARLLEEIQTLKANAASKADDEDLKTALQKQAEDFAAEKLSLEAQILALNEFKAQKEQAEKDAMIESFSTLADEAKAAIIAKKDEYSLDELETVLSIAFARQEKNRKSDPLPITANIDTEFSKPTIPDFMTSAARFEVSNFALA